MSSGGPSHPLRPRDVAIAAILYAVVTIAITWPLFRHPATSVLETRSLYGKSGVLVQRDINLTMWILAWDVHALTTDPARLFHANAFYPAPWSLALSEHMLGNLPFFGPVYLATGNPVLAHQATLFATFVLSGLAMAAWAFSWTRDRAVALVAGLAFAVAPARLWQMGNLHIVSTQYYPIVLLAVDALVDRRARWGAAVLLGIALALAAGCSYYVGYAAFLLAAVYAGTRVLGARAWHAVAPLATAALLAVAVTAPLSLPYLWLQQSGVLPRYGDPGQQTSLALLTMLKFGVQGMLGWFVMPRRDGIPQFLGWTACGLAIVALARHRGAPRGALVAVLVAGVVLSLGPFALLPALPGSVTPLPYRLLQVVVPGFSAMRAPQRMGVLATVAIVALAALGLAWLCTTLRARGRAGLASLLPLVVAAALVLEARPGALAARRIFVGPTVPRAYQWLAAHGDGGPLLELPIFPVDLHRESTYMYYSTYHWLPLLNGYSSYPPASWRALADAALRLPAPEALDAVLANAPRWVLFHRDAITPDHRAEWESLLGTRLRRVEDFGDAVLYERPS